MLSLCCHYGVKKKKLSKLSNLVKIYVIKKTEYNKLLANADNIDTSDFVLKTKHNTDKTKLVNKIPDTRSLVKKTNCNTKITELENKKLQKLH